MEKRIVPAMLFVVLVLASCSNNTNNAIADTTQNATASSSSKEIESEQAANQTDDNMNEWIDVQGIKIRRSPLHEAELAGKKYVKYESYNSGNGGGGYNSEKRMTLCPGGILTTYENSQTSMYVEGMDGSSASEDSDSGTWEVYEDKDGNLYLKLSLKKGGEGYANFTIRNGKMYMGELAFSIADGDC